MTAVSGHVFHRPELIYKADPQHTSHARAKTLAMKTTVPMEVHSMAPVGVCVTAFGRTKSYGTSTVEV